MSSSENLLLDIHAGIRKLLYQLYQKDILERIDVNEKAEDTLMCIDAFHCQKGCSSISE